MKHATVQRDGYEVPLIGIPQDAVIDECDCCGHLVGLSAGQWCDGELLCPKCCAQQPKPDGDKTPPPKGEPPKN